MTTTERDHLLAYLLEAAVAHEGAVAEQTAEQRTRTFEHREIFLQSIGLSHDPLLDSFDWHQKHILLGAYAHSIREAIFSQSNLSVLAESTARDAMGDVSVAF